MDFTGFYHENKSKFAYAVDLQTLHVRLQVGSGAVSHVTLVAFDGFDWSKTDELDEKGNHVYKLTNIDEIPMRIEQSTRFHDYWFAEVRVPSKRCRYGFVVEKKGRKAEKYFFGPHGEVPYTKDTDVNKIMDLFYNFPYILEEDLFRPPAWVADTVWYQIFPERYANSGLKTLQKGELLPWDSEDVVNNQQRYGGDIPGITAHLDEIKDMGLTGIYLTPVFTSPSVHKYDTEDYFQIDPAFGTQRHFAELVDEARKRGIRIMIDLVFNHIGGTHPFWQDVVKKGKESRYYDWFCFREDGSYETFAKVKVMPKWNTANPEARAYLLEIAAYWTRTYNIDGLRLDVANEVSHDFWRVFRQRMREINPDVYILGETWDNGMSYLLGDQFDSLMNYPLATAIWNFVSGKTDGAKLREDIAKCLIMYPKNRQVVMYNLIGTHDTGRILTQCKGRPERVMQAFTLLLTLAGSPMIYYGDEVGISGEGHDDARKCMVWGESKRDKKLQTFVRTLISLRAKHPDLRAVDIEWLKADAEGIVFRKGSIIVALNGQDKKVVLPLPDALHGKIARDLITDRDLNTAITIPPYGVALWK